MSPKSLFKCSQLFPASDDFQRPFVAFSPVSKTAYNILVSLGAIATAILPKSPSGNPV